MSESEGEFMQQIRFTMRVNDEINNILKKRALALSVSKNALINFILSDYFKKEDKNTSVKNI